MKLFLSIAMMAITTYLIRMLPLTVWRKKIKSRFFKSFLAYVPSACLSSMTFPAIIYATNSVISGIVGLLVAIILSLRGKNLVVVAACICIAVFATELILKFIPAL